MAVRVSMLQALILPSGGLGDPAGLAEGVSDPTECFVYPTAGFVVGTTGDAGGKLFDVVAEILGSLFC